MANEIKLASKPFPDGKRYAVCARHAGEALAWMENLPVFVRRIPAPDDTATCSCRQPADFILIELSGVFHGGS